MQNDVPVRRSTWQKLDTAALDTRLVLLNAPSVVEPAPQRVPKVAWALFGVSVAGSMLTACAWWLGALIR